MDTDATPVAPSATPDNQPAPTPEQAYAAHRDEFRARLSGKPIEPTNPAEAAPATSSPATEQAATNPPDSQPGKPTGHKGNADTRVQELLADRARERDRAERLERELAALKQPQPTAARPASQPATEDAEPTIEQFENEADPYASYVTAHARWATRQEANRILGEHASKQQAEIRARESQAQSQACQQRINDALTKDATLLERIQFERFDSLPTSALPPGQAPSIQSDLAQAVLDSENPAALMLHLSENPEAFQRLTSAKSPREFWRAVGQIESALSAPAKEPPKQITAAPPPPETVSSRQSEVDPTVAAANSGDIAAHKRAYLARLAAQGK